MKQLAVGIVSDEVLRFFFENGADHRLYLFSSLDYLFDTGADGIVLWVTHAYAHENMI